MLPGRPRQTGQTCVFGSAPNSVEQPQKIFVFVFSSTWTSKPITDSYFILEFYLPHWQRFAQVCTVLFERVGYAEQRFFTEGCADELHADGHAVLVAAGNADTRQAGQVEADRAHVAEIHSQRIVVVLANAEGRIRCRRCEQDVALAEGFVEVLFEEGPYLHGAQVVRVIVA